MMKKRFQEHDLQRLLGNLLRVGVSLSLFFVLLGLVLYFFQVGNRVLEVDDYNEELVFDFGAFWRGLRSFHGLSIVTLGLLCLIATPVLRVLFSIIGFRLERDLLYTVIAGIVLLIIIASIFIG